MKTKVYIRYILSVVAGMLIMTGCNNDLDFGQDVIVVTGTDSNPVVKFVADDTPATYSLTASATGRVNDEVKVVFAIEPQLIEEYNKVNKTKYYPIPESAVRLDNPEVTISAGCTQSTAASVVLVSTEDMIEGPVYVIPVTIKTISGGDMKVLNASRTIYLRVSQTLNFKSLDMTNSGFYSNYIFDDDLMQELNNFTCEVKFYVNSFSGERIRRLCNFTSKDEMTNMLRLGESGQDNRALQWVSPGGSLVSTTLFDAEKWYMVSLTFDGSKYTMYINGVKEAELSGGTPLTFQRIELGMSWTTYTGSQMFNGRFAEMRVWNRALGPSELQLGLCAVDPASEGLLAYWKFNEGSGYIFHDSTGNGYDMDWSDTYREVSEGGGLQPFDYSSQVRWNAADAINICN